MIKKIDNQYRKLVHVHADHPLYYSVEGSHWLKTPITPICDNKRHLICLPYTLENLHELARQFRIKPHWFHKNHYDIPKRQVEIIMAECKVVTTRQIVRIIRGTLDAKVSDYED